MKSRASLEAELSRREKIPIVVLVIGGGPRTAESVYEAVSKNTPCVFLDVLFNRFLCDSDLNTFFLFRTLAIFVMFSVML